METDDRNISRGVVQVSPYCWELSPEQNRRRRKSRGTKDQLLIDRMILQDCKARHTNLAMAWVNYKKAYDMVPHSWILQCLSLEVADNVVGFINRSMKSWHTELTAVEKYWAV